MEATDYAVLVKRAEEAVQAVKDPELRKVAFDKVLDDLLESGAKPTSHDKPKVSSKGKSATRASTAPRRKGGPQAYVEEMISDAFFKKPKTIAQVKAELENRGHHIPLSSLSGPLQKLCQRKHLRRQKTNDGGKKQTYSYSEW